MAAATTGKQCVK